MYSEKYYLAPHVFIKFLEEPYLYNRKTDDLYEMDINGFKFLQNLLKENKKPETTEKKQFVNFLLKNKLITKEKNDSTIPQYSFSPSLRYLELQLTRKCNLKCKHCYLGKAKNIELTIGKAKEVVKDFEKMHGLKIMVSGGEPLLYSKFGDFNDFLKEIKLRRVLLTNGINLKKMDISALNFDEIQVSIDGLEVAHNKLRGKGTFKRALEGIEYAKNNGIDVSVATMITSYNLNDFKKMSEIFHKYGIRSWGIDLPCVSGYLEEYTSFIPDARTAAGLMKYASGGGYHGSDGAFICGNHLLTVSPEGNVAKCGFYLDKPYGNIFREALTSIWKKTLHIPVSELNECAGCKFIEVCLGGCRFRADSPYGKDRVMCYFYNAIGSD